MPAEVAAGGTAVSVGGQLYSHLAGLLTPDGGLDNTASLLILEPAGKDVGALGALAAPAAAEALADLANAIPAAAASFLDTGSSYDDVWSFALDSAVPSGPPGDPVNATVARVLANNRADFELMARARFDIPADLYHPVRATPTDWLSADGWGTASFRIGGEHPDPAPVPPQQLFIPDEVPELTWRELDPEPDLGRLVVRVPQIEHSVPDRLTTVHRAGLEKVIQPPVLERSAQAGILERVTQPAVDHARVLDALRAVRANQPVTFTDGLRWRDVFAASRISESSGSVTTVSPSTSGFTLSFEYRIVGIQRPWLQPQLCHLVGWTIPGLPAGGLSNGRPTGNPGLLPVLTTRMLAVRNLVVEAGWSDADRARAKSAGTIAFGPFTVTGDAAFDGTRMSRPAPQVVAWLATVVPACPAA